jgi:hypothetical protein
MSDISGILLAVLGALIAAGLIAIGAALRERVKRRRAYGHLYSLRSEPPLVEIVVPSILLPNFAPSTDVSGGEPLTNFTNVLFMPMSEGGVISRVHFVLTRIWNEAYVSLIPNDHWQPGAALTICVGGPSVNSASNRILKAEFADFGFNYPAATTAHFRSTMFIPTVNSAGALVEDFGFIFVTARVPNQGRRVVLCGVSAFGTEIAAACFLGLLPFKELSNRIKRNHKFFAAARGKVEGLKTSSIELIYQETL